MKGPETNDRRSPLPRQTGHGDFPHPAFASLGFSSKHSQRHQSQMSQMRIQADARAGTPTPLTASAQMSPQPIPHEVVQVVKRLPRVAQTKVVGPAPHLPVHPPDQLRQRRVALLVIDQTPQRLPFPRHRFPRRHQIPVALRPPILVAVLPEGVTQKVQALAELPPVFSSRALMA